MPVMRSSLPNALTAARLLLALALLWTRPMSGGFWILYALAGATDIADGFLARRWHVESPLGSRLDTAADIAMLASALYCLRAWLPPWGAWWLAFAAVTALKVASIAAYAWRERRLLAYHSRLNRWTGLCLFAYPFTLPLGVHAAAAWVLLGLAALAAGQEALAVWRGRAG